MGDHQKRPGALNMGYSSVWNEIYDWSCTYSRYYYYYIIIIIINKRHSRYVHFLGISRSRDNKTAMANAGISRLSFTAFSSRVRACTSFILNFRLNNGSDGDNETKRGKLFQTSAAATGNARSRIVECFDRGMTFVVLTWT